MTIAHDGHSYELTSRYSQPQSSAAQLYRNDPYLTQRFIAHLPIEPDTWLRLLGNIGLRNPNIGYGRLGDIHQQVADAIARNDINLYRLPRLDETNCLRGKKDTGLCIIQGPKPHCATRLAPLSIDSPQAASELLNELGITPSALIAHLRQQHLCEDDNSLNPLDDVLTRLAKGELLAYKIPLPPPAAPKKAVEFVPAAGPGYEPVTLGPEVKAKTISAGSDEAPTLSQPKSLDECEKRLVAARERLEKNGYQAKYSDEEQLEKVQRNSVSKERFLVSFQTKNDSPDAKLAFQRESGLVPIWATSFDQLENADSDPQLIADILATPYDPSKDYVLYIIDRGENLEQFGCNTIIPTWENIQAPTQKYLGEKYDSELLSEVMTPEYQMQYARDINTFKSAGLNEFNAKDQQKYASKLSEKEGKKFNARHNVRTEIGANSEFTGNGLTQSREGSAHGV